MDFVPEESAINTLSIEVSRAAATRGVSWRVILLCCCAVSLLHTVVPRGA